MRKFEKVKKKSFSFEKKVSALIPIPKLDLGFGSQYLKLVSVAHYKEGQYSFSILSKFLLKIPFSFYFF